MTDRKRTEIIKGKEVNFVLLPPDETRDFKKVTSVCVIAFTEEGHIVGTIIDRGLDFPGGHVKVGETTLQEVVNREAEEEACIEVDPISVVSYIQSDYYGDGPEDLTYMVVTTAKVSKMGDFVANEEAFDRKILPVDKFLEEYKGFDKENTIYLVETARKLLKL